MVEAEFVAQEITSEKAGSQMGGADTEEPAITSGKAMNQMDVEANAEPVIILGGDGSLTEGVEPEALEIISAVAGSPTAEVEFVAPEITLAKGGSDGNGDPHAIVAGVLTFSPSRAKAPFKKLEKILVHRPLGGG